MPASLTTTMRSGSQIGRAPNAAGDLRAVGEQHPFEQHAAHGRRHAEGRLHGFAREADFEPDRLAKFRHELRDEFPLHPAGFIEAQTGMQALTRPAGEIIVRQLLDRLAPTARPEMPASKRPEHDDQGSLSLVMAIPRRRAGTITRGGCRTSCQDADSIGLRGHQTHENAQIDYDPHCTNPMKTSRSFSPRRSAVAHFSTASSAPPGFRGRRLETRRRRRIR